MNNKRKLVNLNKILYWYLCTQFLYDIVYQQQRKSHDSNACLYDGCLFFCFILNTSLSTTILIPSNLLTFPLGNSMQTIAYLPVHVL